MFVFEEYGAVNDLLDNLILKVLIIAAAGNILIFWKI